jgi:hypothetical protein
MKKIFGLLFISISASVYSQDKFSNVELEGAKTLVLTAKSGNVFVSGKLATGEVIKTGCDHGSCSIKIDYKGKTIQRSIGDDIVNLTVYEYDLGGDGDKEIIVVNEFSDTALLLIYSYGRGMIEKLFDKEVMMYKTVIKPNYIEFYMPSGLDQVWTFYQGNYWEMNQIKLREY